MLPPGTGFSKTQLSREKTPDLMPHRAIIDLGQRAAIKMPPVSRPLPEPVLSPEVRSAILRRPQRAAPKLEPWR